MTINASGSISWTMVFSVATSARETTQYKTGREFPVIAAPAFQVSYSALKFLDHSCRNIFWIVRDDHRRADSPAAFEHRLGDKSADV